MVKGEPVDFLSLETDGDYPVIYDFKSSLLTGNIMIITEFKIEYHFILS